MRLFQRTHSDKSIENRDACVDLRCPDNTLPIQYFCKLVKVVIFFQDFCISIAVIHHFSTPERRRKAIEEMLRITKPGGSLLIFVWAFEQTGKRQYEESDVFVPWKSNTDPSKVHQRYYHMFKKGELEELIQRFRVTDIISGYDRDNWYCIFKKES